MQARLGATPALVCILRIITTGFLPEQRDLKAKAFQVQLNLRQKPTHRMFSIFGDPGSWKERIQRLDLEMKKEWE